MCAQYTYTTDTELSTQTGNHLGWQIHEQQNNQVTTPCVYIHINLIYSHKILTEEIEEKKTRY